MLGSSMPFYDNAMWSTTFKDEEGVGRASSKSLFSFFIIYNLNYYYLLSFVFSLCRTTRTKVGGHYIGINRPTFS